MTASLHLAPSDDSSMDDLPATFRNGAAKPNTRSARDNEAALIRHSKLVGYRAISQATGHDLSWVCRWLQDDCRASLSEVLAWLDVCDLRIKEADGETDDDRELLQILLRKTAANLEKRSAEADNPVALSHAEYMALLQLAKRGLETMIVKAKD